MTTDQDLRDALSAEAGGGLVAPTTWDEVVRRGRRRQRATRARRGAAIGALVAVVAVSGLAVVDHRRDDADGLIATDPPGSVETPMGFGPWLSGARVQGVFLTVLTVPADPATGWSPCTGFRPHVTESADEVVVELEEAGVPGGSAWASCHATEASGAGLIELTDPLGSRRLVDAYTHRGLSVSTRRLLVPTTLPARFPLEPWDQGGDERGWSLTFSDGHGSELKIDDWSEGSYPCDETQQVPVRGTTGTYCSTAPGDHFLFFSEGARAYTLRLQSSGATRFTREDILAIADGLEPLGS